MLSSSPPAPVLEKELALKTPFTLLAVGSSGAGKTTFIERLIENANHVMDRPLSENEIFYFYNSPSFDGFGNLSNVRYVQGLPTKEWVETNLGFHGDRSRRREKVPLIVIDDFGSSLNMDTADLFTVTSHHSDINVVCVVHSLFNTKNPAYKILNDNCKYLVLFKNPRNQGSVVSHLAKQMDPHQNKRFVSIFKEATERPFSYLFIDLHQTTPEKYRLRSNVLNEDGLPIIVFQRH